jgi:hypothetical protein
MSKDSERVEMLPIKPRRKSLIFCKKYKNGFVRTKRMSGKEIGQGRRLKLLILSFLLQLNL